MAPRKGHMSKALVVMTIACLCLGLVSADVYLSPDCPQVSSGSINVNGTIIVKVDTPASCTCLTNGNNSGCVQWVGQDGVIPPCISSATLNFTAKKNQVFTCVEKLNGRPINNITFTPNVVAGPTSVVLESIEQSGQLTFDLCPASGMNFRCQTPRGDAYEIPFFNFYKSNPDTEYINLSKTPDPSQQGNSWSYDYLYIPTKAGNHTLKCRAVNSLFKDLYQESSPLIVTVREPPVITINDKDYRDGDKYQVQDNGYIFASCSVTGGSPAVYNVTLTCGADTLTVSGSTVILQRITAQRSMTGMSCTCSARYMTGCYTLTSSVTLDVTYPPEVTSFTINGTQTSPGIVEEDSYINFVCTATGNPTPNLYITQESPLSLPLITVSNTKLNLTIKASCDHTDMFYCVADNGVNARTQTSKQRSIQVYVKCAPEAADGNPSVYEATVGQDAEIRIKINAYPNPYTFILYTSKKNVYTSISQKVDAAKYTVEYQPQVAPHGTIIIRLLNVKSEDFHEYSLDVINGIKDGQSFAFTLIEAASDTLSLGAIIGIAVGATAAAVIIGIIVAVCLCQSRRREQANRDILVGFDSFGKLGVANPGHYYSSAQLPALNENMYHKPQTHQVGGYPVPKVPDEDYVDVQDHYDYIPADSVYSASTNGDSVAPTEVDFSGTLSSTGGKSIYSATTDNSYLPFNSSSGASDQMLLRTTKY